MTHEYWQTTITQRPYVCFKSLFARDFAAMQQEAFRIMNFLSFVCGQVVGITSVSGLFREERGDILYQRKVLARKDFRAPQVRLWPKDFPWGIQHAVENWLGAYDKIKPALDLYFAVLYHPGEYVEERFLNMARALEAYHRCTGNDCAVAPSEHEKRMAEILTAVPEYRQWLECHLRYSNEPSLSHRLQQLLDKPVCAAFAHGYDVHKVASEIAARRNRLTHPGPKIGRPVNGTRLMVLTEWMKILMEVLFFKEIGFSPDELRQILNQDTYRDRMTWLSENGLRWQPAQQ